MSRGILQTAPRNLAKFAAENCGPYSSDKCQCGEIQTMCHIMEACPLTKLADDGLLQLHSSDDAAVKWLEDTAAMKALAK